MAIHVRDPKTLTAWCASWRAEGCGITEAIQLAVGEELKRDADKNANARAHPRASG